MAAIGERAKEIDLEPVEDILSEFFEKKFPYTAKIGRKKVEVLGEKIYGTGDIKTHLFYLKGHHPNLGGRFRPKEIGLSGYPETEIGYLEDVNHQFLLNRRPATVYSLSGMSPVPKLPLLFSLSSRS